MKREHETCTKCGTTLEGPRQEARGVCGSCNREVTEK